MSLIVAIAGLIFFIIAVLRLQTAFLLFVFSLPFVPRYIAIELGGGALSIRRLMIYSLAFAIFIAISKNSSEWRGVWSFFHRWRNFFYILTLLYVAKFISTLLSEDVVNVIYWMDEGVLLFVMISLAARYISNSIVFRRLLVVVMSSALVTEILSFVEYFIQHPLLQGAAIEVTQGWDMSMGIFRGDSYRVTSMFDNPLLLSEFLCFIFPIAYYSYRMAIKKWLAVLSGVLVMPVIYLTDSRSGILIFMIAVGLLSAYHFQSVLVKQQKLLITLLIRTLFTVGGLALLVSVIYPEWFVETIASDSLYVASTSERLGQYDVVLQAISDRLILGYGMMQNFNVLEGLEGLDNYYLRLLLEGGLATFTLYCIQIFLFIHIASKKIRDIQSGSDKQIAMIALLVSVQTYLLSGIFISMPTNNVYFYLAITLMFLIHSSGVEAKVSGHKVGNLLKFLAR